MVRRIDEFEYFRYEDFACKCCGMNGMDPSLIHKLEQARELAGVPFKVVSGYRCREFNREKGGRSRYSHLYGLAADIEAVDNHSIYLIVSALLRIGFPRIGIFPRDNFVHVDIDKAKEQGIMWTE